MAQSRPALLTLVLVLLFVTAAGAEMTSNSYTVTSSVVSSSGSPSLSDSYSSISTAGQASTLEPIAGTSYTVRAGFWPATLLEIMLGDVNGDGYLDLTDVIIALRIAAGLNGESVIQESDVNGDKRIGIPEALKAIRHEAGY